MNFIIFLGIVLIGFYYEWAIGLLNWVPAKSHFNQASNSILMLLLFEVNNLHLFTYVQSEFLILVLLITITLLYSQLNNLVYRVISLAGLSLLVVGTWAYFTDIIFLYIVYILAFVGAVVMLFLSVILMLPASITLTANNTSNLNNCMYLFLITELAYTKFPAEISIFVIFSLLFIIVWIFSTLCDFSIEEIVSIDYYTKLIIPLLYAFQKLTSRKALTYIIAQVKEGFKEIKKFFGIDVPSDTFGWFTKYSDGRIIAPRFVPVGMFMHDFLFFIYQNIESKLYGPISRDMYKNTPPVWGNLFKVLEYGFTPSRHISQIAWPIPDIRRRYIPTRLAYSIHNVFPFVLNLTFIKYIYGSSIIHVLINRTIFLINLIYFIITHVCYNIYVYILNLPSIIETLLQVCLVISIFLFANPFLYESSSLIFSGEITQFNAGVSEGLSAIKHILYEENILYLVISVIGLLIALIGSAIFTRPSK